MSDERTIEILQKLLATQEQTLAHLREASQLAATDRTASVAALRELKTMHAASREEARTRMDEALAMQRKSVRFARAVAIAGGIVVLLLIGAGAFRSWRTHPNDRDEQR